MSFGYDYTKNMMIKFPLSTANNKLLRVEWEYCLKDNHATTIHFYLRLSLDTHIHT